MPLLNETTSKSVRAQWLWLVFALSVVGGATAFNLYLEYGRAAVREHDKLSTQARVITENMEHQLASANLALESVRGELVFWKGAAGQQEGIRHLKAITSAMTGIRTMNVIDAEGVVLASNRPNWSEETSVTGNTFCRSNVVRRRQALYFAPIRNRARSVRHQHRAHDSRPERRVCRNRFGDA